ncbi:MAG: T9SS type A sorting domain-containing protein [Crocinitomicaceae bacterium]|nr:T9SS type A sorting domain-containing protein [Crocinitomicaceae bacterium]
MKSLLVLFFSVSSFLSISQGIITNVTMEPLYPYSDDTIYIYVDMTFSTSSCPLDASSVQVVGTEITASSQHCLGLLQSLCNTTDTIVIMPLPAAINYNFNFYLSVGSLPQPCTPGIVPDDTLFFDFGVIEASSRIEDSEIFTFNIEPNPSNGLFKLSVPVFIANNFSFEIYNNQGKIVKEGEIDEAQKLFDFDLNPGVYYMSLFSKSSTFKVTKKIIFY